MDINSWLLSLDELIDDSWDEVKKGDLIFSSQEDQAIADAIKSNDSTVAARVWTSIADGSMEIDQALLWVHHVAKKIKADVIENKSASSSERERGALKAIGFAGRVDKHQSAKEFMRTYCMFDFEDNDESIPSKPFDNAQWYSVLKSHDLLPDDMSRKTALNRISEWRKELNIE